MLVQIPPAQVAGFVDTQPGVRQGEQESAVTQVDQALVFVFCW